mgnify:CR=1 FL=1
MTECRRITEKKRNKQIFDKCMEKPAPLDKYIKTTYTVFHFRKEYKNLGTGQEERL